MTTSNELEEIALEQLYRLMIRGELYNFPIRGDKVNLKAIIRSIASVGSAGYKLRMRVDTSRGTTTCYAYDLRRKNGNIPVEDIYDRELELMKNRERQGEPDMLIHQGYALVADGTIGWFITQISTRVK